MHRLRRLGFIDGLGRTMKVRTVAARQVADRGRFLIRAAASSASAWVERALGRGAPPPARVGGPLDAVNDGFHRAYDDARADAELAVPVCVVVADALIVFHRGERRERSVVPTLSHVIKSAAHAPVALFAALDSQDGALDANARRRIERLQRDIAASLSSLANERGQHDDEAIGDVRELLEATLAWARRALEGQATSDAESAAIGRRLLRLTTHATRIQLAALDESVEVALSELSVAERRALQVIVTGDHQARARSLAMQYFQKRFGEREGAEEHVAYAEGVTDPNEALALVGRRRLDEAIATAFFGDPKRLQRDVLGDAARAILADRTFAPLGPRA